MSRKERVTQLSIRRIIQTIFFKLLQHTGILRSCDIVIIWRLFGKFWDSQLGFLLVILEDLPLGGCQLHGVAAISIRIGVGCWFDTLESVVLDDYSPHGSWDLQNELTTFGTMLKLTQIIEQLFKRLYEKLKQSCQILMLTTYFTQKYITGT